MVSKTHGPKKGTTGGACGRKGAKFGGMRHTRKKQPGPVEKKAKQQNKIKRGAQVVVAVKQEYAAGKKYDVGDVLKICRLIDSGKMSKADMLAASKKGVWLPKWRVPAKTIYHWMGKEKGEAEPRWHKLAKDGKLPSAGRECVLGRADHVLMCAVIMQHRARVPYKAAAIKLLARRMLIELGAVDPATKKAYTEESDLTGWYRAFMGRCEQNGARIKVRKGHGQGTQRKGSIDVVEYYRDEVSTVFTCPALARALVFFFSLSRYHGPFFFSCQENSLRLVGRSVPCRCPRACVLELATSRGSRVPTRRHFVATAGAQTADGKGSGGPGRAGQETHFREQGEL